MADKYFIIYESNGPDVPGGIYGKNEGYNTLEEAVAKTKLPSLDEFVIIKGEIIICQIKKKEF